MRTGHLKGRGEIVFGRGFRVSVGSGARRLRHCAGAGWVAIEGVCACIGTLGGIRCVRGVQENKDGNENFMGGGW